MAYNRNQARALCTDTEYAQFEATLADHIEQHSEAQLLSRIRRLRTLRDKYRDLYKRQRLATRARTGSKKGGSAEVNARTEKKARLFEEAIRRLTDRMAYLERRSRSQALAAARAEAQARARAAAAARAAARATRKAAQRPTTTRTGGAGFTSRGAATADRKRTLQKTRAKSVQAHVRARGKRAQARRDSRR
ncbi:MAG: hypothetical protein KF911_15645 [Pseudomonadales bacterium]|nr:hypothetical protein [Pseudomonadales bacterium]